MACNSNFSFTERVYIWHRIFYCGQIEMAIQITNDPGVEGQGHILKISPTVLCLIIRNSHSFSPIKDVHIWHNDYLSGEDMLFRLPSLKEQVKYT